MKDVVAKRLEELEMGAIEAAVRGGIERTFIRDIIKGNKKSVRTDKIAGLARALQMDASELSRAIDPKKSAQDLRTVTVAAHVQAGLFAEAWEWNEADQYTVAVPADPVLDGFRLYAAETRGPSMNKRWPEGTVVVFTNVVETREAPIAGKRYVVERKHLGGDAEHTVKLLTKDREGRFWLMPESDDPRFQAPISVEDGTGDGDTVTIIGRVRYAVSRE